MKITKEEVPSLVGWLQELAEEWQDELTYVWCIKCEKQTNFVQLGTPDNDWTKGVKCENCGAEFPLAIDSDVYSGAKRFNREGFEAITEFNITKWGLANEIN